MPVSPVRKQDFPVHQARRYLEPGPIVLVSSLSKGRTNIMTMGWHMVLEFSPSLVACLISRGNHSHRMIRDSGECVINLPTTKLPTPWSASATPAVRRQTSSRPSA